MNKSDIIEKIKKLLEINRSNGATEAEEIAATVKTFTQCLIFAKSKKSRLRF